MEKKSRKQNRLPIFLYREGAFFVTINVQHHKRVFGEVIGEKMMLNTCGEIVKQCRYDLSNHYFNCSLADFVIMPNHVHAIIFVEKGLSFVRDGFKPSPTKKHNLSEIIRGFKTFSSRKIHEAGFTDFHRQRSFYDHIIRDEEDMQNHQQYIELNPYARENDEYYKS